MSQVTIADFASQALVGHSLHKAFPGIPMVGEEVGVRRVAAGENPVMERKHYSDVG